MNTLLGLLNQRSNLMRVKMIHNLFLMFLASLYGFAGVPEGMTPQELNTVRLTAYYAARYGKYLLADLTRRVIKCSQFGFLNPTDSRFYYFSQLVDEYSRMLSPPTCFRKLPRDIIVDTPLKLETFFDCLEWDVQAPPLP